MLISSLEMLVERYTKKENGFWTFRETANPDDFFQIETIDFTCPVKELYRGVVFE